MICQSSWNFSRAEGQWMSWDSVDSIFWLVSWRQNLLLSHGHHQHFRLIHRNAGRPGSIESKSVGPSWVNQKIDLRPCKLIAELWVVRIWSKGPIFQVHHDFMGTQVQDIPWINHSALIRLASRDACSPSCVVPGLKTTWITGENSISQSFDMPLHWTLANLLHQRDFARSVCLKNLMDPILKKFSMDDSMVTRLHYWYLKSCTCLESLWTSAKVTDFSQ